MTDNKIIEQMRQLLRIASDRGASINERELAQRRAERLMVRHRIETLPEGDARARDEDVTSIKVEIKGSSSSMARAVVDGLATLARALSCFCSRRTYRRHIVATIVGTRSDLAYATEFYNAALVSYPSMLKARLRTADFYSQSERRRFRRSYVMGFFQGIAERIEIATHEEMTSTGQELVLASRYQRAEAKACEGRNMRYARDLNDRPRRRGGRPARRIRLRHRLDGRSPRRPARWYRRVLTTIPKVTPPMNRVARPLVGLLILIALIVLSVMSGGSAARTSNAAANTPAPPVLTGWVGADSRLQWSLSWTPEPGGGLVDVASDSEDVYPGVTCRTDAGREITLQGTQDDVNRVSVRIPAGVARCDAYMGGRPASRTRRMFNNVTVGGRAVVGVIDRSDSREA